MILLALILILGMLMWFTPVFAFLGMVLKVAFSVVAAGLGVAYWFYKREN